VNPVDNTNKPETYASILIRKMYDCSDGIFFANVYFDEIGAVGLLFRYFDQHNYYSVDLAQNGESKIRLSKLINDKKESLNEYDIEFKTHTWYRFRIVYNKAQLEVWL